MQHRGNGTTSYVYEPDGSQPTNPRFGIGEERNQVGNPPRDRESGSELWRPPSADQPGGSRATPPAMVPPVRRLRPTSPGTARACPHLGLPAALSGPLTGGILCLKPPCAYESPGLPIKPWRIGSPQFSTQYGSFPRAAILRHSNGPLSLPPEHAKGALPPMPVGSTRRFHPAYMPDS